jgi:hypothetical protein
MDINIKKNYSEYIQFIKKITAWVQTIKTGNNELIRFHYNELQQDLNKFNDNFSQRWRANLEKFIFTKEVNVNISQISPILHNIFQNSDIKFENDSVVNYKECTLDDNHALDPSDYHNVLKLALKFQKYGFTQRSDQLLRRIAHSGYPERKIANQHLKY